MLIYSIEHRALPTAKEARMVILGIDPGIATVGFGIISAEGSRQSLIRCGAVKTKAGKKLSERLAQIYDDITELIEMFKPDAVSVEEIFFNTNITTGISVAQGRGVIILACERRGVPAFEYTPLQIKQAITGYGRSDKKQMMEMVRRLLNMTQVAKPDDASDALAAAICHARFAGSLMNMGDESVCSTI
jgi:crossover junction endodeoxyribonuclease RuvC